jgi:formamidopyrimidine-DNA glycosylase
MPELPEVETIVRTLRPRVSGRKIEKVDVFFEKVIREPNPRLFQKQLEGRLIQSLKRWGKHIIIELDRELALVIHLRMTGQLFCVPQDTPVENHTHLIFYLDSGWELRFRDTRKFGTMHLLPIASLKTRYPLALLGPDALDPELTRDAFSDLIKGRKGQVKRLLLDQTFVTGIGNIYADEILWEARIHPERNVSTLSPREVEQLYQAMREILQRAIEYRGTSLRDYVNGNGEQGSFQMLLMVHGKEGHLCPRCGTRIQRIKLGGRSTYCCPHCQR